MENPRAVIGDNRDIDAAQRVQEMLDRDYGMLQQSVEDLEREGLELPTEITDDATATRVGSFVKRGKDLDRRVEDFRLAEKEPHLRSGNAVDQWFNRLRDRLARRARQGRLGIIDFHQTNINGYLERKRAAEEAERRRIAEEEARKAREAREEWERQQKAAREAALAAERARAEEAKVAKTALAEHAKRQADEAQTEALVAAERAQEAHIQTLAKPADMVRTRGDDGVLLTQAREPYAILLDRTKLDWMRLAPFFTEAEVEKALRAWARNTGHDQQMNGAEIGFRRKGVTR